MKTAQQLAVEITDAIEEFEQHHAATGKKMADGAVDNSNLNIVRESEQKHLTDFLGNMNFIKVDGERFDRKDIEQHIAGILANKTQDEVDTFLQQLHNDVSNARTLHNHIGQQL